MNKKQKRAALALSVLLLGGAAVGGTYAWLKDSTAAVTNTFTAQSNLIDPVNGKFTLMETAIKPNGDGTYSFDRTAADIDHYDYENVVPGVAIPKQPKVELSGVNADCYVYLVVNDSLTGGLSAKIDNEYWKPLNGKTNVFYTEVSANSVSTLNVLDNNQISAANTLTGETINEVDNSLGKIEFTAYLVQNDGKTDALTALNQEFGTANGSGTTAIDPVTPNPAP